MAADAFDEALPKRYPALQRLGEALYRRRIPWVRQLGTTECGAACLVMVLRYHGREVRLDEVRDVVGVWRDGLSALAILRGAQRLGLRGRGIRVEPEELAFLPAGTILHWELNHFVVLDRFVRRGVEIVDPALGRRTITMEELGKAFTGVAVLLEP
ncbi:MAG: cysteine peptidase family C39 domain-containing protein, partial [Polyangia bacterium]